MTSKDPSKLQNAWPATILYKNGIEANIWYTAFPMEEARIGSIISISSDYPRHIL